MADDPSRVPAPPRVARVAPAPGPPHPAPPPKTLLDVIALVAMNGYAAEVERCVDVCTSCRTNAELWARVVDLQHAPTGGEFEAVSRLMHFAAQGDVARVRELLGRGASVDQRDSGGRTTLYHGSHGGHVSVVRELLDRGAGVDACAHDGWSPLLVAAARGHTAVVEELLAHGADANVRDGDGGTPLMHAAIYGQTDAARALLRAGADVNAQDHDGWSALILAAFSGMIDVVRLLLAAPGVNVNLATSGGRTQGRTALSWACDRGRVAIAELLEAAGAH